MAEGFNFVEKRNVIVIGRTGVGKSTLINKIVGKDILEARYDFVSVTKDISQISGRLKIGAIEYDISFIDTRGVNDEKAPDDPTNFQIIFDIKKAVNSRLSSGVNLILITLKLGDVRPADKRMFRLLQTNFKPTFWKLAYLVFTHCDLLNEQAIEIRKQQFKANNEIAQKFEDRILTVGFPNEKELKEEFKESVAGPMESDVAKLHNVIKLASVAEPPDQVVLHSKQQCSVS